MIDFATQRNEICRIGRSLFERGYLHGTAGSMSMRVSDGYLVTPAEACLGVLHAEQLAHIGLDGRRIGGPTPHWMLPLHQAVYAADDRARCALHTESAELVALSLLGGWQRGDAVPPLTPAFVTRVGHVPLVAYRRPGDAALAEQVGLEVVAARERRLPLRALLLERLGPLAWHETPAAVMALIEEIEAAARTWRLCERRGLPLSETELDGLRLAYRARW